MAGFNLDLNQILKEREQEEKRVVADPYDEFLSLIFDFGFDVNTVDDTRGKIVRVDSRDGKKKNKHCWYKFEVDAFGVGWGVYGDWREGETHTYRSTNYTQLDPEQRKRSEEAAKQRAAIEEERLKKRQSDAAEKAKQTLYRLQDCPRDFEHPYLQRKSVPAIGMKTDGNNLYIPVHVNGDISSYQCITAEEKKNKFFLTDGRLESGYHFIQGRTNKVYFVEGYATGATIHKLTGASVVVCFFASNLYAVIKAYRHQYQEPIIIAADNDHVTESEGKGNPGIDWANRCAKDFNNITVIHPEGITGSDFNDLAAEKGEDAVRETLGHKKKRIEIVQVDQMPVQTNKWFVKRIIPQKKVGVIIGPSGHMKSFITIDLALHLAAQMDWAGNLVKEQHDILYVCGEGASGIRNRVMAWKQYHKVAKPLPFFMTTSPVLFLEKDHVSLMVESLQDFMIDNGIDSYPSIIIIDTLNRNFGGGDENSTQDMTQFVSALDEVSAITGSMFLVVHHTSKANHKQARGNASLYNASDFEYRVEMVNQDAVRELEEKPRVLFECTKMKDAGEPRPIVFEPEVVDLYKDEDGDQVSSVVMVPSAVGGKTPAEMNVLEAKTVLKQPIVSAKNDSEKTRLLFRDSLLAAGRELIHKAGGKPLGFSPYVSDEVVSQQYRQRCKHEHVNDNTMRGMKKRNLEWFVSHDLLMVQEGKNPGYILKSTLTDMINEAYNHG